MARLLIFGFLIVADQSISAEGVLLESTKWMDGWMDGWMSGWMNQVEKKAVDSALWYGGNRRYGLRSIS